MGPSEEECAKNLVSEIVMVRILGYGRFSLDLPSRYRPPSTKYQLPSTRDLSPPNQEQQAGGDEDGFDEKHENFFRKFVDDLLSQE